MSNPAKAPARARLASAAMAAAATLCTLGGVLGLFAAAPVGNALVASATPARAALATPALAVSATPPPAQAAASTVGQGQAGAAAELPIADNG